jgi:hypothetical protein
MPYILVEDFKGGIDTRRTVVTSVPGSCVTLTNAHITRGGEIEKRRAFKLWATLPANTHGLAAGGGRVFVFGSRASELDGVDSLTITTAGTGYVGNGTLSATGGGGSGFAGTYTITSGAVTAVVITTAGSGYTSVPTIVLTPASGTGVGVESLTITTAGTSYVGSGTLSATGGAGSSFAGTYTVSGGAIATVAITNSGTGYTSAPTIVLTPASGTAGSGAVITPTLGVAVITPTLPTTLPPSLSYVRFQHPDLATTDTPMTDILGHDFFNGNVYASAQFEDGKIYHYWDKYVSPDAADVPSDRINDWYETRARTSFTITGGTATGTSATTTVTVAGGTNLPGNNLRVLRINNVNLISAPIAHTGLDTTTAAAIVTAITNNTSTPNYSASAVGAVVTITSVTGGTGPNGFVVYSEVEGDFTVTGGAALSAGADNAITDITVNGVSIIEDPILWETSHANTATKIRDEINKTHTDPEWEATSVESSAKVNIISYRDWETEAERLLYHDKAVVVTKTGNLTFTPVPPANTVAAVFNANTLYLPGGFVRVFDDKMHALSDSRWHQSCITDPSDWNGTVGTLQVTIDLANHSRGSEELMAIAPYFQNLAIFGLDAIQIWFNDPDIGKITRVQVLNNTGTVASKSVVEIGDSDVFYLSRSGIRSLKSRDSSNAAFVGDIGNPIDDLVVADIAVNVDTTQQACGIVDPRDGRYLLAIGDKVYVFSYFPGSKVSAWSIYEHGFTDSSGDVEPITEWAFDGTELLCRAGDKIYSLGGEGNNEYDSSVVTVQLPFLDAAKPATSKMWSGLDAVCSSDWVISTGVDATDISLYETAATINKPTYGLGRVSLSSTSSHIALRMVNTSSGPATLGNIAVHYELNEAG